VWSFSMNRTPAVSTGRTTRRDCHGPKHGSKTGITRKRCPGFGCRLGTTRYGRGCKIIIIIIIIFVAVVIIIVAGWHCCLILKAMGIDLFESVEGG